MKLNAKISIFSALVISLIVGIFFLNYRVIHKSTNDMYMELEQSTGQAATSVTNLLNSSIESYLRGIAEKNIEFIEHFYKMHQQGKITEAEARKKAAEIAQMQSIGSTGYMVAVENRAINEQNKLILAIHKYLPNGDCTALSSCQGWARQKNGYNEYDWKNPGDTEFRKKAAYLQYFEPYKWTVGATTFKDELTNLINIDGLRKAIKNIRINQSGYLYIIDQTGKVIVHPELEGTNVRDVQDASGRYFVQDILQAKNGKTTYLWKRPNEEKAHERYAHFRFVEDLNWYIVATGYTSEANAPADQIKSIGILSVVTIGLFFILALFLTELSIVIPIKKLNDYVSLLKGGNFNTPQAIHSKDELGTLATSFHEMAANLGASIEEREKLLKETTEKNALLESFNERLENEVAIRTKELVRTEKLAALGSLVAGVAHELNTPIGNALLVATTQQDETRKFEQALQTGLKRSVLEGYIANAKGAAALITTNLHRAAELITSFKRVAVDQASSQRRIFMLDELVHELLLTLQATLRKTPYKLDYTIDPNICLDSFPGPLDQVLTNLVNNAVIHGFDERPHGLIQVIGRKSADGVVLQVIDDGRGIPAADLSKVFDPFFTTRFGQGGSGLGLNIVHTLVTGMLGGDISLESTEGQGTTITLTLPLTAPIQKTEKSSSF